MIYKVPGERRAVSAAESWGQGDQCRETAVTRRAKMVKSLSQDTGCYLPQEAATLATSASDFALNSKAALSPLLSREKSSSPPSSAGQPPPSPLSPRFLHLTGRAAYTAEAKAEKGSEGEAIDGEAERTLNNSPAPSTHRGLKPSHEDLVLPCHDINEFNYIREYKCEIDIEFPKTQREEEHILTTITTIMEDITTSDIDLEFLENIVHDENPVECAHLDFPSNTSDLKELPWSQVEFKAESLTRGSTFLNFSLTFKDPPRNENDVRVYRIMELFLKSAIENLNFIKSIKPNDDKSEGVVRELQLRFKTDSSEFFNDKIQMVLTTLRETAKLMSGENVARHISHGNDQGADLLYFAGDVAEGSEAEINDFLKQIIVEKSDRDELNRLLKMLTPASMREIAKIAMTDNASVQIEMVKASKNSKHAVSINKETHWLFPFDYRKLSDLPRDMYEKINHQLSKGLPVKNKVWTDLIYSMRPYLTTDDVHKLEADINRDSPRYPYSIIIQNFMNHEGTLGGLLTALAEFKESVEDLDKDTVDAYVEKIEATRQEYFNETWHKLKVMNAYMTGEEFQNMHTKFGLRVGTNVMRDYKEIKPNLEVGDQLWMLRKGTAFHRSYAHVAIVSQIGDNVKLIQVAKPNCRAKSCITEDDDSSLNENEKAYFILKPCPPAAHRPVDPSIYKKRAEACVGIRFDYDHKNNCEYFGHCIHGEWKYASVQKATGPGQKFVKGVLKSVNKGLMTDPPLSVQMKQAIQEKGGLMLPHEVF